MLKVKYTCSDSIMTMVRDHVVRSVSDSYDACSADTWERVKRTFACRHHTKPGYVNITAVEYMNENNRREKQ